MERKKVYIAVEHDAYADKILGVFEKRKDADDAILESGGYGDKYCALSSVWREIQIHELIN